MKRILFIGIFGLLGFLQSEVMGQGGEIRLTMKAIKGRGNVPGDDDFTYRFYVKDDANHVESHCFYTANNPEIGVWRNFDHHVSNYGYGFYIFKNERFSNPKTFTGIKFRAWEDNKGKRCLYWGGNNGDRADKEYNNFRLNVRDYAPGITHTIYFLLEKTPGGGQHKISTYDHSSIYWYSMQVEFSYTAPVPEIPNIKYEGKEYTGTQLCQSEIITLGADVDVKSQFNDQVHLEWLYHIDKDMETLKERNYESYKSSENESDSECSDDRCAKLPPDKQNNCDYRCSLPYYKYTKIPNWRKVPNGKIRLDKGRLSVQLEDLPGLENLKENSGVTFRARAIANNILSDTSAQSIKVNVSPLPPSFSTVTATKSCANATTGSITVAGVYTPVGDTYRVILQKGTKVCDDPTDASCIGSAVANVLANSPELTIPGLAPGDYTLYLLNEGGNIGNCNVKTIVSIGTYSPPQFTTITSQETSCFGGADGKVVFGFKGGKPGDWECQLTLDSQDSSYQANQTVNMNQEGDTLAGLVFENLTAGKYLLSITDPCGLKETATVYVQQPSRVKGMAEAISPDCSEPFNGQVIIRAEQGSGQYHYRLYQNNALVAEALNKTGQNWTFSSLANGDYKVAVRDALREDCPGYDTLLSLQAPAPLVLQLDSVAPVSCFQAGDGQVWLQGQGGSGALRYTLVHQMSGQKYHSEDGELSNLPGGAYQAILKNQETTCLDSLVLPELITVPEPEELLIQITSQNITCSGDDNGALSAKVTGGNGNYTYQWQFDDGNGWTDYNLNGQGQGTQLDQLFAARYRLKVNDPKGCQKVSEVISLEEPELLLIEAVDVDRPACKGEVDGKILPIVKGGWLPYRYEYATQEGGPWQLFDENTNFGKGTYYVRVTDAEGCRVEYGQALEFVQPDEALAFTHSLKTANGYHLTCFESQDGETTLQATGGITPYLYAVDGGDFQTGNVLKGLSAGEHILYVKDANGCVLSETVTLTQPTPLELTLVTKTDVKCFGDNSGHLEVKAKGGVEPYTYALEGEEFQAAPVFEGLTAQTYTVRVKDANGCEQILPVHIESLYDPIEIVFTVSDVTCYGSSDGAVQAQVLGGSAPYTYRWQGFDGQTQNILPDIPAGEYSLEITDAEGCKALATAVVNQPPNIDLGGTVTLCQGQSYLLDASHPEGAKYAWTSTTGFTSNKPVVRLSDAGTYTLTLTLKDGCVMRDQLKVERSEILFEANFLGGSEAIIADTLSLIEVSYPAPDSVLWDFGRAAQVLDDNAQAPQITFQQAGTYTVKMKAYYAGCVDSLEKRFTFYLPEDKPDLLGGVPLGEIGIQSVKVYPNPNSGQFTVEVKLFREEELMLFVYDLYGQELARVKKEGSTEHSVPFNLTGIQTGMYLLKLVTPNDERSVRVVIE
ncbi:T9SS type A sorting domain-containing protein [Rapidithrix thailandica]|uniref:T9SS type A sorting domain-containing protein n=1 Tax=Rapidithrix thailandica TaxID=413964 RepID=A0AAW9SM21_9BACT